MDVLNMCVWVRPVSQTCCEVSLVFVLRSLMIYINRGSGRFGTLQSRFSVCLVIRESLKTTLDEVKIALIFHCLCFSNVQTKQNGATEQAIEGNFRICISTLKKNRKGQNRAERMIIELIRIENKKCNKVLKSWTEENIIKWNRLEWNINKMELNPTWQIWMESKIKWFEENRIENRKENRMENRIENRIEKRRKCKIEQNESYENWLEYVRTEQNE